MGNFSWYEKGGFWKFDWKVFLWDVPFIFFPVFCSRYLVTDQSLFELLPRTRLAALMVIMSLLLAWYTGFVYVRYKLAYHRYINGLLVLLFVYFWILLNGITITAVTPFLSLDEKTVHMIILITFSFLNFFFLPAAFYGGMMTGKRALGVENVNDEKYYARWFAFFLILILWIYAFRIPIDEHASSFFQWTMIVLMVIIPPVLGILLYKILRYLRVFLERKGLFDRGKEAIHIILPLVISTLLVVYSTVGEHEVNVFHREFSGMSATGIFLLLCAFGVVPFRVYLLFSPPLKGINLVISGVTLTYYLWTLTH